MISAIRSALISTFSTIFFVTAVLYIVEDYRFISTLKHSHVLVAAGISLITWLGLFFVFKPSFLKKYFLPALILPLIWFSTFTWAYGFMHLPESETLGDYYIFSSLLFSSAYIIFAWKQKIRTGAYICSLLLGFFYFLMTIIPSIYIAYYIIYKSEMDLFAMMAIAMTNIHESLEFIQTVAPPAYIISTMAGVIILFSLCLYFASRIMISTAYQDPPLRSRTRLSYCCFVFITVLFLGGFIRQAMYIFPIKIYRSMHQGGGSYELLRTLNENLGNNAKNISFLSYQTSAKGTHIVIIGESANRDHMDAFTPDYPEKTTPWETDMSHSPDFAFNTRSYANFPSTALSLTYALTSTNQYNNITLKNTISLVDAAKAAGYDTYWISFQGRSSLASAGVSVIGERCDKSYWEGGLDTEVLKTLKRLPSSHKRIIFIHLNGSHYNYSARFPMGYGNSTGISPSDPYYDYDVTLAYDDQLLKDIFTYAKENMNLQTMIYFSDHGEDMAHYHGTAPFTYDMARIPFWIYISPSYQKLHPGLLPSLRNNSGKVFTNDLLFDTASGLWQIKSNYYHEIYDLSSPAYALTAEQARTMHGKRLITDDPEFRK